MISLGGYLAKFYHTVKEQIIPEHRKWEKAPPFFCITTIPERHYEKGKSVDQLNLQT